MTKHRTDRKVKVRVRVAVVNLCFCCSNFSAGAGGAVFLRTQNYSSAVVDNKELIVYCKVYKNFQP